MTGDDLTKARSIWQSIAAHTFAEGDLPSLFLSLHKKWNPGSLAAELARALLKETNSRGEDPEPEPLLLADIEHLPKTARIDGILPLTIPAPTDATWSADELIEEAARLKLGRLPKDRDRLRDELALAHLPLLHHRPIISTHRLAIMPGLASPGATLLLLGKLPLGGTVTILTSSLLTREHCLFETAATQHFSRFKLHRSDAGALTLAEGKPRAARRKDKWTFRL